MTREGPPSTRFLQVAAGIALSVGLVGMPAVSIRSPGHPVFATITVTTTSDDGPGSLRQAIADAQAGETILFDPALAGATIVLTSGHLSITKTLKIDAADAPGLAISGNNAQRIFLVEANGVGELDGLIISDGNAPEGGGIHNAGTLILNACLVTRNRTPDAQAGSIGMSGGNAAGGGGIYNLGDLRIGKSEITANSTGNGGDAGEEGDDGGNGGPGGGIYNRGILTLDDSLVGENRTGYGGNGASSYSSDSGKDGGAGGAGGGIWNQGVLILHHTGIRDNVTGAGGQGGRAYHIIGGGFGGVGGHGAGIYNLGFMKMQDSLVANNASGNGGQGGGGAYAGLPGGKGGDGGGVFCAASATINRTSIRNNQTGSGGQGASTSRGGANGGPGGDGGGVYLAGGGSFVINSSEISANQTGNGGNGGDGLLGSGDGGTGGRGSGLHAFQGAAVVLNDCTISNNVTGAGGRGDVDGSGGDGAGIYGEAVLAVHNGTIADNSAAPRGRGGGIWSSNGVVLVRDTIVAGNTADAGSDCYGTLVSGGYNLLFDSSDCSLGGSPTGNIVGVDPRLGPLQANPPGSTATHAIPLGSPAIDAGACSGGLITLDQRGVPRPQGAACDIGAYEFDPAAWRFRFFPLAPRFAQPGK